MASNFQQIHDPFGSIDNDPFSSVGQNKKDEFNFFDEIQNQPTTQSSQNNDIDFFNSFGDTTLNSQNTVALPQ